MENKVSIIPAIFQVLSSLGVGQRARMKEAQTLAEIQTTATEQKSKQQQKIVLIGGTMLLVLIVVVIVLRN